MPGRLVALRGQVRCTAIDACAYMLRPQRPLFVVAIFRSVRLSCNVDGGETAERGGDLSKTSLPSAPRQGRSLRHQRRTQCSSMSMNSGRKP